MGPTCPHGRPGVPVIGTYVSCPAECTAPRPAALRAGNVQALVDLFWAYGKQATPGTVAKGRLVGWIFQKLYS